MINRSLIFLFFLFFYLPHTISKAIEPDIFVQSTVNRASQTLSKDISKNEKISSKRGSFK